MYYCLPFSQRQSTISLLMSMRCCRLCRQIRSDKVNLYVLTRWGFFSSLLFLNYTYGSKCVYLCLFTCSKPIRLFMILTFAYLHTSNSFCLYIPVQFPLNQWHLRKSLLKIIFVESFSLALPMRRCCRCNWAHCWKWIGAAYCIFH